MAAEDYIDFGFDPYGIPNEGGHRCKHCGRDNLEWEKKDGRWQLVTDSGKPHICRSKQIAKASEFEDVTAQE